MSVPPVVPNPTLQLILYLEGLVGIVATGVAELKGVISGASQKQVSDILADADATYDSIISASGLVVPVAPPATATAPGGPQLVPPLTEPVLPAAPPAVTNAQGTEGQAGIPPVAPAPQAPGTSSGEAPPPVTGGHATVGESATPTNAPDVAPKKDEPPSAT